MGNKIFIKISLIIVSIIGVYSALVIFLITPEVSKYFASLEIKQVKTQLKRVETLIKSKEIYLKDFKKNKEIDYTINTKNITQIVYEIIDNYYQLYKDGILSKTLALEKSLEIISKISYGKENDYLYILDSKGEVLFHPDEKFKSQNVYKLKDKEDKPFIKELITNTIRDGQSNLKYSWSNSKNNAVSNRIVYGLYFEAFDVIIASSIDTKKIDEEIELVKEKTIAELNSLIQSITKEDLGYIFVINGKGLIVVHPNNKIIYKDKKMIEKLSNQNFMLEDLISAYKNKKVFEYKWNKNDDEQNFVYDKMAWVVYNDYFDFYICSAIYKDDLNLKSKEINGLIVDISLFATIILLLFGILFIKKLLYPISILSKNADLVKEGNFAIRNNIKSKDELGLLGNHFDGMLDFIEENTKSLEYKIEARTAELKHKLYYDDLTNLKNRESLNKDLKKNDFLALTLIDIQQFNDINELYGFEVGNEVLIKVMKILSAFAEEHDVILYRLDSDIFGIVDTNMYRFVSYEMFLEKIQDIFKEEIHVNSLGIDIFVYITMGISISQSDSLKSATIALKKAKYTGVQYLVYNKEIDTKDNIKKTMYWREKIKEALEEDRVIPFFQPIYNRNNEIIKYESLMRIYDEVDNKPYYLSPGTFFEVAIKTRQYFKLNQRVIKKVFDNIDKIGKDISINLGFSDVLNLEFNEFIEKEINLLTQTQREKIVFEILESDFISDYEILDNFMFKFREKGIRIAIDDFGTGFSNFSHILKVKPDYIKIDGSLIKNINKDENSYQMVKSIIDFSNSLGIKVIGEYIHSKEVYDIVKELNIDEYQGYFLGEPKPLI